MDSGWDEFKAEGNNIEGVSDSVKIWVCVENWSWMWFRWTGIECDMGTVDGDIGVHKGVADAGKGRGSIPIALFRGRVGVGLHCCCKLNYQLLINMTETYTDKMNSNSPSASPTITTSKSCQPTPPKPGPETGPGLKLASC